MSVFLLTTGLTGQEGVYPRTCKLVTSDSLAAITTAGYLSPARIAPQVIYPDDFFEVCYAASSLTGPGTTAQFTVSISSGQVTLVPFIDPNSVVLPTVNNHVVAFDGTGGKLKGAGFASTAVILNTNVAAGQSVTTTTASATPGTLNTFKSSLIETVAVMTSGTLAALNGSVTMVGASAGSVYGSGGFLSVSGTLSSTSNVHGVIGQIQLVDTVITAGSLSAVRAEFIGDVIAGPYAAASLISGRNVTEGILGSQINLFGGATTLMKLDDNNAIVGATYIATPAGSTPSGALRTLAFSINGTVYQVLAAAVYS